jgi:hypothetical protein
LHDGACTTEQVLRELFGCLCVAETSVQQHKQVSNAIGVQRQVQLDL